MARQLDAIDEKLIAILRKDARKPVVSLAKAVGLSRSAVQGRLARLEDEGTIQGYTIVAGRSAGTAFKAILLLRIETRPCATVTQKLRDWPEIVSCWSVAGPTIDAVLFAEVSTPEELGGLRERLAQTPGIAEITTAPVLTTVVHRSGVG